MCGRDDDRPVDDWWHPLSRGIVPMTDCKLTLDPNAPPLGLKVFTALGVEVRDEVFDAP